MANLIAVEVVTPEETVWTGFAEIVIARGADGELGVLRLHAPLITYLMDGPLLIRHPENGDVIINARRGFLEVKPERVTVLASEATVATPER